MTKGWAIFYAVCAAATLFNLAIALYHFGISEGLSRCY